MKNGVMVNKISTLTSLQSIITRSIFYWKSKNPGIRTILDVYHAIDMTLYVFFNDIEGSC